MILVPEVEKKKCCFYPSCPYLCLPFIPGLLQALSYSHSMLQNECLDIYSIMACLFRNLNWVLKRNFPILNHFQNFKIYHYSHIHKHTPNIAKNPVIFFTVPLQFCHSRTCNTAKMSKDPGATRHDDWGLITNVLYSSIDVNIPKHFGCKNINKTDYWIKYTRIQNWKAFVPIGFQTPLLHENILGPFLKKNCLLWYHIS